MANGSMAQLGAPVLGGDGRALYQDESVSAADAYTDLFLGYATAQGITSHHTTVVIGEAADAFVSNLMGQAEDPTTVDESDTSVTQTADDLQRMKIAWRYDHTRTSTKPSLPAAMNTVFDLSKRIPYSIIRAAKDAHLLHVASLDMDDALTVAWDAIQTAVEQCKAQAASRSYAPVLRIVLRGFGSPAWMEQGSSYDLVRFLLRLRALARSLAMPAESTNDAIPCLVGLSLSPFVYHATDTVPSGMNVAQRLLHLTDGCIGLSSFSATPGLSEIFPDFTGALRVYRTPAIGTLTNPSLRVSILRGMGAGTTASGSANEGGAGGGENNLAFKVKRKRLAIETLHLDIEGGVSERRTKPKEPLGRSEAPSDPSPAPAPAPAPPSEPSTPTISTVPETASQPTASPANLPRLFTGLKDLRQRGLAVAKSSSVARPQDLEF
ncbi:Elongator subunit Elp4 [Malassezia pachydermatis]